MKSKRNARSRIKVAVLLELDQRYSRPVGLLALTLRGAADEIRAGRPAPACDRATVATALEQLAGRVAALEPSRNSAVRLAGRADLIQRALGGTVKAAIVRAFTEAHVNAGTRDLDRVRRARQRLRRARKGANRATK